MISIHTAVLPPYRASLVIKRVKSALLTAVASGAGDSRGSAPISVSNKFLLNVLIYGVLLQSSAIV